MQQQSANLESLSSSQLCNTFSPSCIPHFTPFYVSVIEDPEAKIGATQLTKHEKKLLSEYEQREGIHVAKMMDNDGNPKEWAGETYERAVVKHGDRAFHKFNKKLQLCPQQCLRYAFVRRIIIINHQNLFVAVIKYKEENWNNWHPRVFLTREYHCIS